MHGRRRGEKVQLPKAAGWGGKRKGAGRKPGPHPRTPHRARPRHYFGHPVHVTLRAGLGSLRSQVLYPMVRRAISEATRHAPFAGSVWPRMKGDEKVPVSAPETWLLREGFLKAGRIELHEGPRPDLAHRPD